ncbi:hypothetical protein Aph02nite_51010 [Actinoplanes philippinensis]|uniref:Uncharacterized protein n=1 Tax=Actinoplanes philippinensis TaxID=35752 RepID=A0A1I2IN53_9ACTN|nr:hypothetical protein [Actinoplanes philippinensis]GIE79151.1 hypothetical protein Aph02nite_51010 [Actinoplanes philippinensis]SFF43694.1 hypothetical protein SAMN05421541_110256 [Actinoplanes philippinensis]
MRNMVQLLGGVAVAGVVAAGSTAFTAAGVTDLTGATLKQGGKVAVTVDAGAKVQSIVLTTDSTYADQITLVTLVLKNSAGAALLPAAADVKIDMNGETGTAATTSAACTDANNDGEWQCAPSGNSYWTGPISDVAVSVWLK